MNLRLRVSVFLLSVLLAGGSVAQLSASRGYSTQIWYFADSSQSEIVGEGYINCNWQFTQLWGTSTDFYDSSDDTCGAGGHTWCPGGCSLDEKCVQYYGCIPR